MRQRETKAKKRERYSNIRLRNEEVLTVDAPRWGVHTRFGCAIRALRCSLGGSEVNTSRAAPATLPDYRGEKVKNRSKVCGVQQSISGLD
jgi:hypothetical protein